MKREDRENAVNAYFNIVIKKNWTWNKLTEQEKKNFCSVSYNFPTARTTKEAIENFHKRKGTLKSL